MKACAPSLKVIAEAAPVDVDTAVLVAAAPGGAR
jgi:hypothetical protein